MLPMLRMLELLKKITAATDEAAKADMKEAMFIPTSLITSGNSFANFGKPFLGCIDADLCK